MVKEDRDYILELLKAGKLKDAEKSADALASGFRDLFYVFHNNGYSIRESTGCDEKTIFFLSLVSALTARRMTDKLSLTKKKVSEEKIKEYAIGLMFGLPVETVYALLFDDLGRFISAEHLGDGTVNSSGFLPRKLLDVALVKKAKEVILVHNHPCGFVKPSKNDMHTTYIANGVLKGAGVVLRGHYIVSGFEAENFIHLFERSSAAVEELYVSNDFFD